MSADPSQTQEVIQEVLRALQQLRFGSIEITVHEGRVTQIEKREKVRFGSNSEKQQNQEKQQQQERQQNQELIRSKPTATAAAHT